jgi:DNA-binding IclR family transcriptional regulator
MSGRVFAGMNVSAHANRITRNEMRERFLPGLRRVAKQLSASMA